MGFDENKVLSPQEKGILGVEAFIHEYIESGGDVIGTEIPYKITGVNGRMDLVGKRNGVYELFEVKNVKKLSIPWSFTKNQRHLLPLLEKGHAFEFYGPKAFRLGLDVNTPISKYNYQLIHKNINILSK